MQYLQSIISNPGKNIFVFDYNNILTRSLKLNDIDTNFPNVSKNSREFIIKILKHDMKMFIGVKNYNMDNITTFTTRIPYDGHHV